MKSRIRNRMSICLSLLVLLSASQLAFAQHRHHSSRRGIQQKIVKNLPHGHHKVYVGKSHFYFHHGHFYRPVRQGFAIVSAPIGARIHALPAGVVSFRLGPITYYHYLGTYYRYDPAHRVYVVVRNPREDRYRDDSNYDRIKLYSGKVLYGRYLGGTDTTIEFETNEDIYEFGLDEIEYIKFARF